MKLYAALLLIVGLLQIVGDLTGLSALKGIGAATCASRAACRLLTRSNGSSPSWAGPTPRARRASRDSDPWPWYRGRGAPVSWT